MKSQTIDDYFHIAKSMVKKQAEHPVYPQREDIVQEAMLNLAKGTSMTKKYPSKTIYYSLKNTYNRKTLPEFERSYATIDFDENINGKPEYKTIDDKIAFKEFMAWLPTPRLKDMFTKRLVQDMEFSEIAKEYGVSRQILYVHYHNTLTAYKQHIGLIQ